MKEVKIRTEYITLGQLIKYVGYISQGGEIKQYLQDHEIRVNNEIDNRRGRKLYNSDVIEIVGKEKITIKHDC